MVRSIWPLWGAPCTGPDGRQCGGTGGHLTWRRSWTAPSSLSDRPLSAPPLTVGHLPSRNCWHLYDGRAPDRLLPLTPSWRTASGGNHYFFGGASAGEDRGHRDTAAGTAGDESDSYMDDPARASWAIPGATTARHHPCAGLHQDRLVPDRVLRRNGFQPDEE